ncbi:MAG: hemolysin family protein [Eubacteriales bacterium]|nr:hemolysin family protein [Eubacteriales bacterium]
MDDPLGRQLLLQFLLILVNAFFAASEIAVVSLNANKLKKDAEEGNKKAARMLKMVEQPTSFLSAIQICITLAGFLGSAFAAENFSDSLVRWLVDDVKFTLLPESALNTLSVVLITIILSFFTLVLGELVPKRIAMHSPMKVAAFTTPVVRAVAIVMKPVIWLLSVSTAGVMRLFGIKDKAEEEKVTEDEIRMMVDIGEESGTIDSKEREMIDNIFEFDNSTAKDVMTRMPDVISVSINDTDEAITTAIADCGFSRIPVWEDDPGNIIGILIVKEYLLNLRSEHPKPLREILRPTCMVPETIPCDKLFTEMQKDQRHMVPVINEYGELVGIVTLEDLIEEILGNIYDETDDVSEDNDAIVELAENTWRIPGNAELDDVRRELDVDIPDDVEANTLGGLVISCLTEIPEDGATFEVDCCGLHIKVDRFAERRVESAIVTKLAQPVSVEDEEH